MLATYDVVITSYAVLESEYRRVQDQHKVACHYCSKRLLPRTLRHHLHYFCGPGAQRTARLGLRDKKRAAPVIRSELVLGKMHILHMYVCLCIRALIYM